MLRDETGMNWGYISHRPGDNGVTSETLFSNFLALVAILSSKIPVHVCYYDDSTRRCSYNLTCVSDVLIRTLHLHRQRDFSVNTLNKLNTDEYRRDHTCRFMH